MESIEEFITVEMVAFQVDPGHDDARALLKVYRMIANFSRDPENTAANRISGYCNG
jgi:hypothetical protein